jgi:NAD(P)-dependent dehydrogenase (short-subunit alcohol dehydrogenase family)
VRSNDPRGDCRGAVSGSIINIASINALHGRFGQANYAASKAGSSPLRAVALTSAASAFASMP